MKADLSPEHLKVLEVESMIAGTVIDERGYRTIRESDLSVLKELGFVTRSLGLPGLLIPLRNHAGQIGGFQFRSDVAVSGRKQAKYLSPRGQSPILDVPPAAREKLHDASVELWITEGAKKADSAVSHGLCCVSLSGVWCFRRRKGGRSTAIPDLDEIPLRDRMVVVCYDSDVMSKPEVQRALDALRKELESRGAVVEYALLEGSKKTGLDDYFSRGGTVAGIRRVPPNKLPQVKEETGETHRRSESKESVSSEILKIAFGQDLKVWRSKTEETFATFSKGGHLVNAQIRSEELKAFLYNAYKEATRRQPSSNALEEAINILHLTAKFEGPVYPTALRIHREGATAFLFLADDGGTVIRVDANGWDIEVDPSTVPVQFVKQCQMVALPMPSRRGSFDGLKAVLNLSSDAFVFVKAWLLGNFLAAGAIPILLAMGDQGSGKTSGCRFIRSVLDPNRSPTRTLPSDPGAFAAAANGNHTLVFDNVSKICGKTSDLLCGVASGQGIAGRTFYTNTEEYVVAAHRPIIINGIGDLSTRPDLIERTLPIRFLRIDALVERRREEELQKSFDENHPAILGALLDSLVMAFRQGENLQLNQDLPRLADLAYLVTASETVETIGTFIRLLKACRSDQNADLIGEDSLASAVVMFLRSRGEIIGSATEILAQLSKYDPVASRSGDWPSSPTSFKKKLERFAVPLAEVGITIETLPRTAGKRSLRLFYASNH